MSNSLILNLCIALHAKMFLLTLKEKIQNGLLQCTQLNNTFKLPQYVQYGCFSKSRLEKQNLVHRPKLRILLFKYKTVLVSRS